MLTLCWSPKGGSGASVTAAALALSSATERDTLLVDLGGDQPALLGLAPEPDVGLTDWLAAPDVPVDALGALEQPVRERLRLLPRGAKGDPTPERLVLAIDVFATSPRPVVVDAGAMHDRPGWAESLRADRHVVVIRSCYLAVRRLRALGAPCEPSVVVVVEEAGRALRSADVASALAPRSVVSTPWDPAVARAVDAGLLAARLPRSLARLSAAVAAAWRSQ